MKTTLDTSFNEKHVRRIVATPLVRKFWVSLVVLCLMFTAVRLYSYEENGIGDLYINHSVNDRTTLLRRLWLSLWIVLVGFSFLLMHLLTAEAKQSSEKKEELTVELVSSVTNVSNNRDNRDSARRAIEVLVQIGNQELKMQSPFCASHGCYDPAEYALGLLKKGPHFRQAIEEEKKRRCQMRLFVMSVICVCFVCDAIFMMMNTDSDAMVLVAPPVLVPVTTVMIYNMRISHQRSRDMNQLVDHMHLVASGYADVEESASAPLLDGTGEAQDEELRV